jgi:DNA-binding NtrC family response regulator
MVNILVVEDRDDERASITETLQEHHHQVFEAANVESAKQMLSQTRIDIALVDMRMPLSNRTTRVNSRAGLAVIDHAVQQEPSPICIVITAYQSVGNMSEAISKGAWDYIEKPFSENRLLSRIESALEQRHLGRQKLRPFRPLIGGSEAMRKLHKLISKAAQVDATVLITGETGTGKELVARAIHYESARRHAPFIPANCSAIPSELQDSEFSGHKKGAFTGADTARLGLFRAADDGTIFLDEIGEISMGLQPKLLSVLQERSVRPVGDEHEQPVNVRVIAATKQDIVQAVKRGQFRNDLYYRLKVFEITVPSLRERQEDIPVLANYFFRKHKGDSSVESISDEAMNLLYEYHWPGNIRQLENAIQRAIALTEGRLIRPSELPEELRQRTGEIHLVPNDEPKPQRDEPQKTLYKSFKRLVELGNDWNTITDYLVAAAMAETEVDARAAALIGMPAGTLRDKKGPIVRDLKEPLTTQGISEREIEKLDDQLGNLKTPQQRKRLLEKFPIHTEPR